MIDGHYLECARAALALRIEAAKTTRERRDLRDWLAEIEIQSKQDIKRCPILHPYKPHRKWPWFCSECGYPEHETLKHPPRPLYIQQRQKP